MRHPVIAGLAVGLWLALTPFLWLVAWLHSVGQVDQSSLQLGGAGPDEADFVDMGLLLRSWVVMVLVAAALIGAIAFLTAKGLDRQKAAIRTDAGRRSD
jgi:hypothetical protein